MNKATFLTTIISLGIIGTSVVFAHADNNNQCNANNPQNCPVPSVICDLGEHVGNPHCITPTPTVSCTPSPTEGEPTDEVTPDLSTTPTAGVSATVTPTEFIYPTPTEGSGGYFDDGLGCGHHSCASGNSAPAQPQAAPATGRAEE